MQAATTKRPRPFTPDDIYAVRRPFDPQVSPNGRMVAWAELRFDRDANETQMSIYTAPIDGRTRARRFSWGKRDHTPRWSPDGRYLAFLSDRGEKNQIYLAPLDGGDPHQLTKEKHGVNEYAWSPDGTRIAYTARTGPHKDGKEKSAVEKAAPRVVKHLRYRLDGIGYFDERRMHVFVVDIHGGEPKQITDGDWYDQQPAWSPDGRTIAFTSDRERNRHERQFRADVWTVPASGGRARRISRARGSAAFPAFSRDGRWIAYIGDENDGETARHAHLLVVPATGGAAPRSLSASLDRGASALSPPLWSRDGRSVFFVGLDSGRMSIVAASARDGSARRVLDGQRQIQSFALTPDGTRVAFAACWASNPHEIYSASLENGTRERNLSRANEDLLSRVGMGITRRLTSRAPDGVETESFVVYPPDYRPGRRYPLILSIHGGPHGMHPQAGFGFQEQAWAGAGYVVLMPNPRGSAGYGEAFQTACVRDWGGGDFDDLMAAVDSLVRRRIADPERLFVGGYSYGGFMTAWAIGHTDRFKAAVIGAPVANHLSMIGTTDIPLFSEYEIGGAPYANRDEWVQRSPLTYLHRCVTPALIEHHEGDLRCPIGQAEEIFTALKRAGCETEFVRYPGGFHRYDTHAPSQHVDSIRRSIAWFDGHGGRVTRRKPRAARRVTRSTNGARPQARRPARVH